jgi:hypothetical protein
MDNARAIRARDFEYVTLCRHTYIIHNEPMISPKNIGLSDKFAKPCRINIKMNPKRGEFIRTRA